MITLRDAPGAPPSWPFAPIEELDVYLENAREPSLVQLETHAQGHLDPAALEAALAGALAADPSARRHAAATPRWSRHLRWETGAPAGLAGPGLLTVAGWGSPGQLAALREQLSAWPMSLEHTAARVLLAAGPEHDVVIVQVHHAAFDGISSLALLAAICAGYQDAVSTGRHPRAVRPSRPGSGPALPQVQPPASRRSRRGRGAEPRRGGSRPGLPTLPGVVTRIAAQAAQPDRPGYGLSLIHI